MLTADSRKFLLNKLREIDPSLDLRNGTALVDLFVNAGALIYQPLIDEIIRISQLQSLAEVANLDDASVNQLVGNLFVYRRGGQRAQGAVRLFFNAPVDIAINKTDEFTSSTGLIFHPVRRYVFSAAYIASAATFDGTHYTFDITVEAESEGEEYNVEVNDIISTSVTTAGLAMVNNPFPFQDGIDRETNRELVDRARKAITTRVIVTDPGIETMLKERFSFIKYLTSTGYGDPEMLRDIVIGTNIKLGDEDLGDSEGIHIGGKVDVYIKTDIIQERDTYVDNAKRHIVLRAGRSEELDEYGEPLDPYTFFFVEEYESEKPDNYLSRPVIFVNAVILEDIDERLIGPTPECFAKGKIKHDRVTKGLSVTHAGGVNVDIGEGEIFWDGQRVVVPAETKVTEEGTRHLIARVVDEEPVLELVESLPTTQHIYVALVSRVWTGDGWVVDITDNRPDFDIITHKPTLKNSVYDEIEIHIIKDNLFAKPLRIIYTTCEDLKETQDYIERNRVVCADIISKFMTPCFLNFTLKYKGDLSEMAVKDLLVEYIHNLSPGARLEVSDMVDELYREGITYVELPITMKSFTFNVNDVVSEAESQSHFELGRLVTFVVTDALEYMSEIDPTQQVLGIKTIKLGPAQPEHAVDY